MALPLGRRRNDNSEATLRYLLERIGDLIQRLVNGQVYLERPARSFAAELEERAQHCQRRIQDLGEQRALLDAELNDAQALLLDYEAVSAGEKILNDFAADAYPPLMEPSVGRAATIPSTVS